MKNKHLHLSTLVILFLSISIISCRSETSKKEPIASSVPNFDDAELVELSPERNELAQLMLVIYAQTEAIKNNINQGNDGISDDYLIKLKNITAVKNGIDAKSYSNFVEYSHLLEEEAQILQHAKTDKTKAYNNMINSCILCHEQFCPKMVPKIEKLLIK